MTVSQAKGMLRFHEMMARIFRHRGQLENLVAAERRAEVCRRVITRGKEQAMPRG